MNLRTLTTLAFVKLAAKPVAPPTSAPFFPGGKAKVLQNTAIENGLPSTIEDAARRPLPQWGLPAPTEQ